MTPADSDLDRVLAAIRSCRHCVETPRGRPLPHDPRPVLRCDRDGAACRMQPGPRNPGAPLGHAFHRRLRRPPARLDGGQSAGVLRRCLRGHRAHGVLLSGPGRQGGGPAAAPRMLVPLARAALRRACRKSTSILAVGSYAQRWHMASPGSSLQETMLAWREHLNAPARPRVLPLPHPSWRNNAWLRKNPWFERDLLPVLRDEVRALLHGPCRF